MPRRRRVTTSALASLELSPETMRSMVERALARALDHLASLPAQPMHATAGGRKLSRSLLEPMPERGRSFESLLGQIFGRIIPGSLNTASPGYMAYIPGGGLFHSAVADFLTSAVNRYVGVWQAAPGLVQIEANVIGWFCALLGLPEGAGGVLTTGGSMANLTALLTARRERLPEDFLRGVLYVSDQTHHSVHKAAALVGIAAGNVREIPTDERFRLQQGALVRAIAADRARGLAPFLLVANAGSTNTGAIDDLEGLARLAAEERLWLHVDAAYGGFFALTERGRARLRGIELADSVTLDPHKSLFLPYGTGALVVRDEGALRRAHHIASATYLPPMQDDAARPDFCDLSPELSREPRGLRVWLPLKMHGAGAFRAALDEKLDLAEAAASALRLVPLVEIVAEPELSLLVFRMKPVGMREGPALDALNRRLLARINERQRVLLSGTVLRGAFVIRICILSFRTHRDRVQMAIDDVRECALALAAETDLAAPGG